MQQVQYICWRNYATSRITWSLLLITTMFIGCSKQKTLDGHTTPLQLFNAMDDGINLSVNLNNGQPVNYFASPSLTNKSYNVRHILPVTHLMQSLHLFAYPDTLAKDRSIFSMKLNLEENHIYSLFLSGTKEAVDTLFIKEKAPVPNTTDSIISLRVINLYKGAPISVNIKSKITGSFLTQINFHEVSDFIPVRVGYAMNELVIEFRDMASKTILAEYTFGELVSTVRAKYLYTHNSLVFSGKPEGTGRNAPKVTLMGYR